MREKIWLCLIISFSVKVVCKDSTGVGNFTTESNSKCWMSLMTQHLFQNLEKINKQYDKIRDDVKQYLDKMNYTTRLLEIMLIKGAVVHHGIPHQESHGKIPSGLRLGGRCSMTLPTLVVFFHHMKLREDAFFRVKDLYNDFENMVLKGHLLLNGLYLTGAYDTSFIDHDPSNLKHTPSFGELQITLKDVEYSLEARYRLKKNRFVIVFTTSNLQTKNISVKHTNANKTDTPIWLDAQHMGDFMTRLKTDLNQWMQDYFNDCLSVISVADVPSISKIQEYDRYKTAQVTVFADNAILRMNKKLRNIGGDTIRIPSYKLTSAHGLSIDLFAGTLRGLETMYRLSEATALLGRNNLHYMDTIVGFKDLKISYAYDINYPPGMTTPQYSNGVLIMSANKQIAHLSLSFINETKNVELDIDFLNRMRANDITIEGAADILTTNFEHILHHEIATIMANSLQAQDLLKTLPNCDPVGMLKKDLKIQIIEVKPTWKGRKSFRRMNLGELKSTDKMMSL